MFVLAFINQLLHFLIHVESAKKYETSRPHTLTQQQLKQIRLYFKANTLSVQCLYWVHHHAHTYDIQFGAVSGITRR